MAYNKTGKYAGKEVRICVVCGEERLCFRGSKRCLPCNTEYSRQYKQKNRDKVLRVHRESRMRIYYASETQRWKDRANKAVAAAIRKGTTVRQPCEHCGREAEAHHDSYLFENWLNVRWLCREAHEAYHAVHEPEMPSLDVIEAYEKRSKRRA